MVKREFSKFAKEYAKKNIIQKQIIKQYAPLLENRSILDLGCGNGALLEFCHPSQYIGIDFSKEMLNLHPNKNIFCFDFNQNECWNFIKNQKFEILVSFSALQWANDLDFIFTNIKSLNKPYLLAIFTSNTFKTIHKTANITSPIHSKEKILNYSKVLNPNIEILEYKLYFEDKLEMFRYIKRSGVSSGEKKLSYKEIKNLIYNYPLNYLEFEILILKPKNMWEKHHHS
jgi:malonyl-CoA O-methyltransferase